MRVAIVNDIVLAAEVLKRLVLSVPGYEVAWVAYDGDEAIKRCLADKPDLVLMDLVMPGISGAETTRQIMNRTPCAILVVTASVSGNISLVFDAMGHGALDVTVLPLVGNHADSEGAKKLLEKLKIMQRLIGVLLTGMGKNGAEGLKGLKEVGWQTIAQDRESCVVYGMPKAAIEIGAATHILPLEAIAPEIVKWVNADFSHTGRSL